MSTCDKGFNFSDIIFLILDLKNLLDSKDNTLVKLLNVSKGCSHDGKNTVTEHAYEEFEKILIHKMKAGKEMFISQ